MYVESYPEWRYFLTQEPGLAAQYTTEEIYTPGEDITFNGECVYILMEGNALLKVQAGQHKYTVIDLIGVNFLIGLYEHNPNMYIKKWLLTAVNECKVFRVDREYFLNHFYVHPTLFSEIFLEQTERYKHLSDLYEMVNINLENRLAYLIINWGKILSTSKDGVITIPSSIKQYMLAEGLRASPASITIVLNNWENKKIIQRRKSGMIFDEEKLGEMVCEI
ncbi:cAMP-binding domain-containing protein [Listeria floridensis FSL S10-1187]|uniref:cAMP-binding domain-containing protein n=1 Tax=Listeria floridensis FSL S10-1187 TaxID=1265817 RepID=A0ABN0RBY0_9LIST|nr:Crp/Fnr family transcriptional regulator [Listeria floridensis]EUJ26130.1 cAMP-binding domain-containing protein [Listeria floridensis FSL S10-1187]